MVNDKSILKIVHQQPGDQTGEKLYQTEDGTWWRSVQFKTPYGTGQRTANKLNGYIREND